MRGVRTWVIKNLKTTAHKPDLIMVEIYLLPDLINHPMEMKR